MQATSPYETESTSLIYELLFCDRPELYQRNSETSSYPWSSISAAAPSLQELEGVANDDTIESRIQLLAYNRLKERGATIITKELLGVVIEVGLKEGLDTLAAYKDGSCRYINHSGKMIMWNTVTEKSTALIEQLFSASQSVVNQIGPWDKARLTPPGQGLVRLSFLVSDGLYFGQGPFDALQNDALAGGVIHAAKQLMLFLTEHNYMPA